MGFQQVGELRYYEFDLLGRSGLVHGIFTRHGGISPSPWNSLNVGGSNGDERKNVIENRRRLFNSLGLEVESLYDVWQVHSADVIKTDRPRPLEQTQLQADAIITGTPGITLFMRFGDCVPILLYDPVHKAIGLVHAGWIGTVKKTVQCAVKAMMEEYHSNPADILAGIGPSIGPEHYEVGDEVVSRVYDAFGEDADICLMTGYDKPHFNLWMANQILLEDIGVLHIQQSHICTAGNKTDWFSHRGDKGSTGRFGAVITMKP